MSSQDSPFLSSLALPLNAAHLGLFPEKTELFIGSPFVLPPPIAHKLLDVSEQLPFTEEQVDLVKRDLTERKPKNFQHILQSNKTIQDYLQVYANPETPGLITLSYKEQTFPIIYCTTHNWSQPYNCIYEASEHEFLSGIMNSKGAISAQACCYIVLPFSALSALDVAQSRIDVMGKVISARTLKNVFWLNSGNLIFLTDVGYLLLNGGDPIKNYLSNMHKRLSIHTKLKLPHPKKSK